MPTNNRRVKKVLPVPLLPKTPIERFTQFVQVQADFSIHIEGTANPEMTLVILAKNQFHVSSRGG